MIDLFLQDVSNVRIDAWGGSIENRSRFGPEVTRAVVDAIGAERTAIRLSPFSEYQGMKMKDPIRPFTYFIEERKKMNLAYLHLIEARISGNIDIDHADEKLDVFINLWGNKSPVSTAGGYREESAFRAVDQEYKESDVAIVFGRLFITNPDLVFRVKNNLELTHFERNKFYNVGEEDGYTTWPFSKEFEAVAMASS